MTTASWAICFLQALLILCTVLGSKQIGALAQYDAPDSECPNGECHSPDYQYEVPDIPDLANGNEEIDWQALLEGMGSAFGISGHGGGVGQGALGQQKVKQSGGARGGMPQAAAAVVKVYCTHTEPNYKMPWQQRQQKASTSTGFAIRWGPSGRPLLLTNAHSVEHHSQVQVKRRGGDRKFLASVLAIGPECDLALLAVPDRDGAAVNAAGDSAAFWEGLEPIPLGEGRPSDHHLPPARMPELHEPVTVVGYPAGGDSLSVTSGIVSRVEVTEYVHGGETLLGIQIDAAINPGNSGGPVFEGEGGLVGVAFQKSLGAGMFGGGLEAVGWIIPISVVAHFLADVERNGRYTGFPALSVRWQTMENDDLRHFLGVQGGEGGVMITKTGPRPTCSVVSEASASRIELQDVILEVDGQAVAPDGTVPYGGGERVILNHRIREAFIGDVVPVTVLRNKSRVPLELPMAPRQRLIPRPPTGERPPYYVLGGFVFTVATTELFGWDYSDLDFLGGGIGGGRTSSALKVLLEDGFPEEEGHEVIVLAQVLATDMTRGYEDLSMKQVTYFGEEKLMNLRQLVALVDAAMASHDDFLVFHLEQDFRVVLNATNVPQATAAILAEHNIPKQAALAPEVAQAGNAGDRSQARVFNLLSASTGDEGMSP